MHTFLDNIEIVKGVPNGSYAGTAAGAVTFGTASYAGDCDGITYVLSGTAAAQAGSVSLAVYSATASDGSGSAAISGASTSFVGTAVAADTQQIHAVTVKPDQLPAAAKFVLPVVTVFGNSAVLAASVVGYKSGLRNKPPANSHVLSSVEKVA